MTLTRKDRFDPDFPLLLEGARLYILVRTDISQLNPGKLGAQAAHAGTQFVFDVLNKNDADLNVQMKDWADQGGGGFGTKITLAATEAEIREVVAAMAGRNFQAGLVVDPTYPMLNYFKQPFTRSELTCGYVFCPPSTPGAALEDLKQFNLHP